LAEVFPDVPGFLVDTPARWKSSDLGGKQREWNDPQGLPRCGIQNGTDGDPGSECDVSTVLQPLLRQGRIIAEAARLLPMSQAARPGAKIDKITNVVCIVASRTVERYGGYHR
jgi:hypothetical protein